MSLDGGLAAAIFLGFQSAGGLRREEEDEGEEEEAFFFSFNATIFSRNEETKSEKQPGEEEAALGAAAEGEAAEAAEAPAAAPPAEVEAGRTAGSCADIVFFFLFRKRFFGVKFFFFPARQGKKTIKRSE